VRRAALAGGKRLGTVPSESGSSASPPAPQAEQHQDSCSPFLPCSARSQPGEPTSLGAGPEPYQGRARRWFLNTGETRPVRRRLGLRHVVASTSGRSTLRHSTRPTGSVRRPIWAFARGCSGRCRLQRPRLHRGRGGLVTGHGQNACRLGRGGDRGRRLRGATRDLHQRPATAHRLRGAGRRLRPHDRPPQSASHADLAAPSKHAGESAGQPGRTRPPRIGWNRPLGRRCHGQAR
jgi:hypothetical protein